MLTIRNCLPESSCLKHVVKPSFLLLANFLEDCREYSFHSTPAPTRSIYSVLIKSRRLGLPFGGSVVKNLPANTGDIDLIPGLGRSYVPHSNKACVPQLLSLCFRAQKPQLLTSAHPRAYAPQKEKPPQWETCTPQLESSPPHQFSL